MKSFIIFVWQLFSCHNLYFLRLNSNVDDISEFIGAQQLALINITKQELVLHVFSSVVYTHVRYGINYVLIR